MLYCARRRFAEDAMDGTGNDMAVMATLGHENTDTTRIYNHPALERFRAAMNKRNQDMQLQ